MKLMEDNRLYLLVDTAKLYDEVIPQLKGESSKVDNKQAGGSNNVVEKKKLLSKKAPYSSYKEKQPENAKDVSSKKLPTHQKVMQRFAKQLKVNDDAIYSGVAAQQAIVRYAVITHAQTGTTLGRDDQTGETWFKLSLTLDEIEIFVDYYLMHHSGWIQDITFPTDDWIHLVVYTAQLYDEVIPQLKGESSKVDNKQLGSSKNVVEKKLLSKKAPYRSYKEKQPENTKDVSSKKLPTHQEVMQRFAQQLQVNYNAVYSGIAAEQAIVRYAGITRIQTGAAFRRDSNTGRTWFKLRLNSYEADLFISHYQTLHPDAIKKRETLGNDWVRITFDTRRLYDEIIPKLV